MSYAVEVLCDSAPAEPDNPHRLTTFLITFPRFILAEFNTHRMLSRNSASSRAIPISARIKEVKNDPFIPEHWGSAKRGMQAGPDIKSEDEKEASRYWLEARDKCIHVAEQLDRLGVHKQLANRVLEPFSWVTVVVTATDWDNFFHLRTDEDAQPEFRKLAVMMREAYWSSVPQLKERNEWHLPFIEPEDRIASEADLIRASVGRCARVSYVTHKGVRDLSEDVKLANSLRANGHMSPYEHVAICQTKPHRVGNFIGWTQARKLLLNEADPKGVPS